jgi:hypothetical protein
VARGFLVRCCGLVSLKDGFLIRSCRFTIPALQAIVCPFKLAEHAMGSFNVLLPIGTLGRALSYQQGSRGRIHLGVGGGRWARWGC